MDAKSIAITFAIIFCGLFANKLPANSDWKLTVRDKPPSPTIKEEGAKFWITEPEDGDNSYLIDLALNFKRLEREKQKTMIDSISIESHKNNQIDKEVDTLLFGYTRNFYRLTNFNEGRQYHNFTLSIKAKEDYEKDNQSGIFSITYNPKNLPKNKESWWTMGRDIIFGEDSQGGAKPPRLYWTPNIGIVHEKVLNADDDLEGEVTRLATGISVKIYLQSQAKIPKANADDATEPQKYMDGLTATLNLMHWEDLDKDDSVFGKDDSHELFELKFAYPLDQKGNVNAFLLHYDGENPVKGEPDQEYTQLGLEFKLDVF